MSVKSQQILEIKKCFKLLHVNQKKRADLILPPTLRRKIYLCSTEYIDLAHRLLKEVFPSNFEFDGR